MILEECKYIVKEKKVPEYISDSIEISSDYSGQENANKENSDKENPDKENCNKEN